VLRREGEEEEKEKEEEGESAADGSGSAATTGTGANVEHVETMMGALSDVLDNTAVVTGTTANRLGRTVVGLTQSTQVSSPYPLPISARHPCLCPYYVLTHARTASFTNASTYARTINICSLVSPRT
jgi:hypothetical protein